MNGKEISRLSGYTGRVHHLISTLDNLESVQNVTGFGKIVYTEENLIKFDRVPIVTPNGDILINVN